MNDAPVMCLHSGGFTSRQWKRLVDRLAPRRVLAPDLVGYGRGRPLDNGTPFHYRDDLPPLRELLDQPMHLVGHSYGGLLALQLALAQPDRVLSLALFEPVAMGVLEGDEWDGMMPVLPYDGEPWLERFVDWWQGAGAWKHMPPEARAAFLAVGWKVYCEVSTLVVDRTTRAQYGTIAVPTLLLGGGKTPVVEQRVLAHLAAALPRARLVVYPEMGHMGPITHAPVVNDAIAEFVAGQTSPS